VFRGARKFCLLLFLPLLTVLSGCGGAAAGPGNPTPTIVFSAAPATINAGDTAVLTWNVTGARSASIDNGIGSVPLSGTQQVKPQQTTTYTLTAVGANGPTTATTTVTVNAPVAPAPTIQLTADHTSITTGQPVTLSWTSTNATSISIDNGIGSVAVPSGSTNVSPTSTTTYTATATGAGGTTKASVVITVTAPVAPTISSFTASPTTINKGDVTTLSWQTSNTTSVSISPGTPAEDGQPLPLSGSTTGTPSATTTYTLTATGPGGSATAKVTVTVNVPAPTLTFSASPNSIPSGQTSTLSWSSTNADSITIDNGIGSVAVPSGTQTVTPTTTTTYTATAKNSGGSVTATATVTVTPQLAVSLTADKAQIASGDSATLTWTSQGAASVDIEPTLGQVALSGSASVAPQQTTTYTATAKDSSGNTKTAQVTITVVLPAGLSSIKHIIFFLQENRSFDNYFGMLGQYKASKGLPNDVDGLDPSSMVQKDQNGVAVHPYHQVTTCAENTSPSWNPSWHAFDQGAMDGFITAHDLPTTIDPQYHRVMAYYNQTDLPYYYELATQFATSDRWFSPVMSATIPNRMYVFGATSAGHIYPDPPPQGGFPIKTIFELLQQNGISWRYYYMDNSIFLGQFAAWNDPAIRANVRNISEYYSILADPNADNLLPQVIFIERASSTGLDEHPDNNTQKGAAVGEQIIDALLKSAAWPSSVFIHTYDEFGGLYDHVAPISVPPPDNIAPILEPGTFDTSPYPNGDFAHSGFRIPVIVISPWVKPQFVSHTPRDTTSILKFIETRFGLPSLTARDAWADNMMEFFDFSHPALLTPPPLPPQPTNEPCDFSLELNGSQ
jgi:phospholipase C